MKIPTEVLLDIHLRLLDLTIVHFNRPDNESALRRYL